MPASKLSHEDACFGSMIWRYEKPSCSSTSALRTYQEIHKGVAVVCVKNDATAKSNYYDSILTLHLTDQLGVLPMTIGLALHHKTSVCGQPAYQSNIEDVVVLILSNATSAKGYPLITKFHLASCVSPASRHWPPAGSSKQTTASTI